MNETPSQLLTTKEAADLLRVSPATMRRWDRDKKLIARRLPSGAPRYAIEDLLNLAPVVKQ